MRWRRAKASLSGLVQSLGGVLPHGLKQAVAAITGALLHVDERLVDQATEESDRFLAHESVIGADVLCRLEGEAPGEHREPPQEDLLVGLEQIEAPSECRPQRLLPGHRRAASPREQVERVIDALDHLGRREHADPGRRELDREGHPVEAVAEGRDRDRVLVVQLEAGGGLARPNREQPDRLRLQRSFRGGVIDQLREREGRDPPGHLTGNAERLAAGRQHGEARAVAEQRLDEVRDRLDQVLAVVEQEQLLAIADVPSEGDLRGAV